MQQSLDNLSLYFEYSYNDLNHAGGYIEYFEKCSQAGGQTDSYDGFRELFFAS